MDSWSNIRSCPENH